MKPMSVRMEALTSNTRPVRPGRFLGTTGPALNVEDFNETSINGDLFLMVA
jgi:hypothetical protein